MSSFLRAGGPVETIPSWLMTAEMPELCLSAIVHVGVYTLAVALSDLTSREAVERALDEFDELGRDRFLATYQFGLAKSYFVIRNGKPYDSKAIAGAAHGHQHPDLGPLQASDFSGGDATVRARLESLGFTVVFTPPRTTPLRPLRQFEDYDRRDVHDIFSPQTDFTPGAGLWGLQGIVEYEPGEFLLFVTFGREQGDHKFDEGITTDGVLTWQSQPKQTLEAPQVVRLIGHDSERGNVRLFLRTRDQTAGRVTPYTYLGRLAYRTHDAEREQPVHFQWQLIDVWPPPQAVLSRMGLTLSVDPSPAETPPAEAIPSQGLVEATAPSARARTGTRTRDFRTRKAPDWSVQDARNRALGLAGELAVVAHEQRRLREAGRDDLASEVRHIAVDEGDGAGCDVKSFEPDGTVTFIEVKTTRGSIETDFLISVNEVEFSLKHPEQYCLYRLFAFDAATASGSYYVRRGSLRSHASLELAPVSFRARIIQPPPD